MDDYDSFPDTVNEMIEMANEENRVYTKEIYIQTLEFLKRLHLVVTKKK
jgi:hypothetical protein